MRPCCSLHRFRERPYVGPGRQIPHCMYCLLRYCTRHPALGGEVQCVYSPADYSVHLHFAGRLLKSSAPDCNCNIDTIQVVINLGWKGKARSGRLGSTDLSIEVISFSEPPFWTPTSHLNPSHPILLPLPLHIVSHLPSDIPDMPPTFVVIRS